MEFIASRGFVLPISEKEMESLYWFNLWEKKQFPFKELVAGDKIYWFETVTQRIVWESKAIEVERFKYGKKQEVLDKYPSRYGSQYYENKQESGYCIAYKVIILNRLNLNKPRNERMPQLGWLRVNVEIAKRWLNLSFKEEESVLDDTIDSSRFSLFESLEQLNNKMKGVAPNRVSQLVNTTIRKDTQIIRKLKEFHNYTCQFPNCRARILKKTGEYYIEVAHVKPVKTGGKSVLGNLIVLCPNHHKEFDYGDLIICKQTEQELTGRLNGRDFEINLNFSNFKNIN